MRLNRLNYRLIPVAAALIVAGCATIGQDGATALERRVDSYYAALIKGDYRDAYGYFTPGHRKRFSFEQHYQAFPPIVRYESVKTLKKECATPESCKVEVLATFVFRTDMKELDGVRTTTTVPERWVQIDGRWWILPPR